MTYRVIQWQQAIYCGHTIRGYYNRGQPDKSDGCYSRCSTFGKIRDRYRFAKKCNWELSCTGVSAGCPEVYLDPSLVSVRFCRHRILWRPAVAPDYERKTDYNS